MTVWNVWLLLGLNSLMSGPFLTIAEDFVDYLERWWASGDAQLRNCQVCPVGDRG